MGREGRAVGQATVWSSRLGEHARRGALVMGRCTDFGTEEDLADVAAPMSANARGGGVCCAPRVGGRGLVAAHDQRPQMVAAGAGDYSDREEHAADSRKGTGQPRETRRPLPGPRTSTRRLTCGRASIHDVRAAKPTPPAGLAGTARCPAGKYKLSTAPPLPLTPRHTNRTKGDRTARRWDSRPDCTGAARTSRVRPRTPVVTTVVAVSGIRRREGTQINVPGPWTRPGPTRRARPTPIRDPIPSPTGRVRRGGQRSDRSDHDRGLDANDQNSASRRRRGQAR